MIKLTIGQIRDPLFNPTLAKLSATAMPIPTARRVQKIIAAVSDEQKIGDKLFADLAAEYLEAIPTEPNQFRVKLSFNAGERAAAEARVKEFIETPIEIQIEPINDRELMMARLSAVELQVLHGIIDGAD